MHSLLTGTGLAKLSSNIYNDSNNEEVNQMANQQHLDLLTQNVETWYQWRNEYPDVQPDLSGGRLSYAKLSKSDFFGADLSGISLSEVNLSRRRILQLQCVHLAGRIFRSLEVTVMSSSL